MKKIQFKRMELTALSIASLSQVIARLTIALVMWPHGAQLLLGVFGGYGFTSSMNFLTQEANLPWPIAFAVIFIQFFGSLFILFGFCTRINSLLMVALVIGMIFSGHVEHGFFMNWMGDQKGEGYEFHLLLLGLCFSLFFATEYKYSVDFIIHKHLSRHFE